MSQYTAIIEAMEAGNAEGAGVPGIMVYPRSFTRKDGVSLMMVREDLTKKIVAVGSGPLMDELSGEELPGDAKLCGLTHANRLVLNSHFPYTAPRAFGTQVATLGLGDRLGLASPGHIQTMLGRDVKPILAQQSIRELNLTGRDYKEVLDAACYAAFQEGYTGGFGADGDHLKVESDIRMSLDLGFTMLTLDCSEKIDNTIDGLSDAEVSDKYGQLPAEIREHYEGRYLGKSFQVGRFTVSFNETDVMKNALIYGEAIQFMKHVYRTYIVTADREIDFEISIDETLSITAPVSHYLVANELYSDGMTIYSMAPRFCGEFQKGIDYIGDVAQFERELAVHAAIADHFGYKLSIHSGSDKFSVFPIIAEHTKGRFHVKTAGTNWLEAVRAVARVNPGLYRRMHAYAVEHFHEALAYYHVKADLQKVKPLDQVSDERLPEYMDDEDARQLIHITYGILLQAKDGQGRSLFKEEFYRTLIEQEDAYENALKAHIGHHLDLLGK